ncbi:porin family protein [Sphingomonas rubra]|uniref:Tetratricopeptide repeat-containing protein n=1 Tax=Sphingomonas rubra TaxID=634430 RepID=A0A1I5U2Z3_9SPHN|nr:porin family protein [Sphingomonas rubra]SFP89685.1 Tetratricopeptide repeat-containing protein [Sphingomonas rubra]
MIVTVPASPPPAAASSIAVQHTGERTPSDRTPLVVALSSAEAFAAVDQLVAAGHVSDAEALLHALTKDPAQHLRSEARFRLGKMRAAAGDYNGAVTWFRALLDEEPGAMAVRLELARTYARLGKATAASRELRRAQTGRLPLNVARQVDRISAALRSSSPRGADVSIGIAPDSNINRATGSRTIDAQGITLVINRDGRATSGIGLQLNGRGYSRSPLTRTGSWLVEASGAATLYPSGRYDDIAGTVAIGPEFRSATAQFRPAILVGRRYFDGDRLSDQAGISVEARRAIGRTAQLAGTATGFYAAYPGRAFLSGKGYGMSIDLEKAVTLRLFGLAGLSISRSDARDPAYATTSIGGRLFTSRDAGRFTIFGGASYQHLRADGSFTLFRKRRFDDYTELQFGVSARLLAILGLIPSARFSLSRNDSTIPFYDFGRARLELTFGRQF